MRTLVVYESMYGNTHAVAIEIAAGLRAAHEVTLVPVTRATRVLVSSSLVDPGQAGLTRRPVVRDGMIRTNSSRSPGAQGSTSAPRTASSSGP